jgi:hypothetical protein
MALQTNLSDPPQEKGEGWALWGPFLLQIDAATTEKNSAGIKWTIPAMAVQPHQGAIDSSELTAWGKKWELRCNENVKIASLLKEEDGKNGPRYFWDFFTYGGWNWLVLLILGIILVAALITFTLWLKKRYLNRFFSDKSPEAVFAKTIAIAKRELARSDLNSANSKKLSYLITGAMKSYLSARLQHSFVDLTDSEILKAMDDVAIPQQSKTFSLEILNSTYDCRYSNAGLTKDKFSHLLHLCDAILDELKPKANPGAK